jgi:hypothetical protein
MISSTLQINEHGFKYILPSTQYDLSNHSVKDSTPNEHKRRARVGSLGRGEGREQGRVVGDLPVPQQQDGSGARCARKSTGGHWHPALGLEIAGSRASSGPDRTNDANFNG